MAVVQNIVLVTKIKLNHKSILVSSAVELKDINTIYIGVIFYKYRLYIL